MPCTTAPTLTEQARAAQVRALERLRAALASGSVLAVLDQRTGALAFKGWKDDDRAGVGDLCAYRAIANTPEMRAAIRKAEARAGVKLSSAAIGAGVHSHDGGRTWGSH